MAKKEDIKKLEENWKQLNQEDKERELEEFRDRTQKKKNEKDAEPDKSAEEISADQQRQKKEFMDRNQQKKDKRSEK